MGVPALGASLPNSAAACVEGPVTESGVGGRGGRREGGGRMEASAASTVVGVVEQQRPCSSRPKNAGMVFFRGFLKSCWMQRGETELL